MKRILSISLLILLILTSSAQVLARNDITQVTLFDGIYKNKYLDKKFSFNNKALGNIGNLTIMNTVDHKLNITLLGLEGFVVVSSQNRTISAILGVIVGVKDGAVSYLPSRWVILDEVGGETDTVTLLVWGYCIGPYDVEPGAGNLEVLMPTEIETIDSFSDSRFSKCGCTRDIVEFSNGLDYPSTLEDLDKVMARSVFFFALTEQDVTPEQLQKIYPNRNIDKIVQFVTDSLKNEGINTEGISMLTFGLGEEKEDTETPTQMIPGFPPTAIILSLALLILFASRTRSFNKTLPYK
jgi:hypothetical protein